MCNRRPGRCTQHGLSDGQFSCHYYMENLPSFQIRIYLVRIDRKSKPAPACSFCLFTVLQINLSASPGHFLLLIREYTRHPPSETNTNPMINISTIPIFLSSILMAVLCRKIFIQSNFPYCAVAMYIPYLCSYQIPPIKPITTSIIEITDHTSICILNPSLHGHAGLHRSIHFCRQIPPGMYFPAFL